MSTKREQDESKMTLRALRSNEQAEIDRLKGGGPRCGGSQRMYLPGIWHNRWVPLSGFEAHETLLAVIFHLY